MPSFATMLVRNGDRAQTMGHAELSDPSRSELPAGERRVVVLCAEPRLAQLLGYWLAPATTELTVAATGRQAAALLSNPAQSTVLITDRVLPPWPGLPTIPALKQSNPRLRVIVVTGRGGGPIGASGGLAGGADETLPRPLSRAAVLRCIVPA